MPKFRVAFDVDLSHIAPEVAESTQGVEAASEVISTMLISKARAHARDELHRIRRDPDMDPDVKTIRISEQMRKMMLTLMAEANLKVDPLPDSATIQTELPFERRYSEAA